MGVPDRPTRFAADLLDAAAVEGARQSRSAKAQLDHWARVGRAVSMQETAARRRIEAALAGTLDAAALSDWERLIVNAEIDAAVQEHAQAASYGAVLASEGVTTVALDDQGNLVQHHPDGSTSALA